ncbi:transposase, partial [Achromatium sp. WMS2]
NKDLLIALLNAILELKAPITAVVLKNPYSLAAYRTGKMAVLDIKACDASGRWFYVEMQINEDRSFDKRAIYYWAKIITEQLSEGAMYRTLQKTYCISILDFDLIPNRTEFHNCYTILNRATGQDDGIHDLVELHYLELGKFNKDYADLTTALDRWVTFFTRAQQLDRHLLPQTLAIDPNISKALEVAERLFNPDERATYEVRLQEMLNNKNAIAAARAEGLTEGRAEGQAALQAALQAVARNLLKILPPEEVAKQTGLSLVEVMALSTRD